MKLAEMFARPRRRPADGDKPRRDWRSTKFVVVDLETTGLSPRHDRIVSYGAVPIVGGSFRVCDSRYSLVFTDHRIPQSATRVHALRDQDVATAPHLSECVDVLDRLCRGAVLVGYHAGVERTFLKRAFRDEGRTFDAPVIDAAELVKPYLPRGLRESTSTVSLERAATALALPVHPPHHALGDALTTATVFLAAVAHLERDDPSPLTTSTLLAISDAGLES